MDSDRYLALLLHTCGQSYEQRILQLLRDTCIADLCYAYKIRTKPPKKLREKVSRKKAEKPEYCLQDVTDVVGVRLVALFKSDMPVLFDKVLSVITHTLVVNPNPFLKNGIKEIIHFKGTQFFDDLSPRLEEITKSHFDGIPLTVKSSREGYSSVHIVCNLDFEHDELPSYCLPIEIQIRTVFEDAWGEIDHKYGYTIRTGKDVGKPINNPEYVRQHLNILKKFTDASMEYADSIRNEAEGISKTVVSPLKIVSVHADEYILDMFKSLQATDYFIDKFKHGKILKHNASDNPSLYLQAAEVFKELGEDVVSNPANAHYCTYYYAKMNEAFCLMSANDTNHILAAKNLYSNLEEKYPQFPLVKMRFGQALSRLGLTDEAIKYLTKAGDAMVELSATLEGKPGNEWPIELPFADYTHMAAYQPKLLGYALWLKLRELDEGNQQGKLNYFFKAYEATLPALKHVDSDSKSEFSIHNNLLYYIIGVLSRVLSQVATHTIGDDRLRDDVKSHVSYIEEHLGKGMPLNVTTADTLMKAKYLLADYDAAKKYAEFAVDQCLNHEVKTLSDSDKMFVVKSAYSVISGKSFGVVG